MDPERIDGLTLLLAVAAVLAVEAVMRKAVGLVNLPGLTLLGLGRLVQAGLLLTVVQYRAGGLAAVGLGRDRMAEGARWGLVWSAGFAVFTGIGLTTLYFGFGMDPRLVGPPGIPTQGVRVVLYFVVGGLLSPVAEEIFFRGVVYGFFRRWGVIAALVTSTVVFVLSHRLAAGVIPVTQTVGGVAFAIAYEKHRSLITPLIIHILGNLAIFSLGLLR